MKQLMLRNLRLFFRDHMAVFFSMLSIFITIGLYVFFLSDTILSGDFEQISGSKHILNLWLISGLMSIGSVTTTLGAYGLMIKDRELGKEKDFFVSSIQRWKLAASYILSAIIIGMVMITLTLLVGQLFLYVSDGAGLTFQMMMSSLGISFLNVSASAVMMFLITSFVKTGNAFTNVSVLIGTLIGFLMGVYIPIGALPAFAQGIIRIFPISHGCALLRELFTHEAIASAIPVTSISDEIKSELGISLSTNGHMFTESEHYMVLILTFVLFGALSLWMYHHKKKSINAK